MLKQFAKDCKVVLAKATQTAGTSAVASDIIDTANFDGVCFIGSLATANAGNFASVEQGDDASLTDGADLAGTKNVPGDNGDSFLIDIYKPTDRYVRCNITRGVSTATGDIYAVLYNGRKPPVSHGSTIDAEYFVSPAEGTA